MARPFEETGVDVLQALMRAHPLGTLVVATPQGLQAIHVPFRVQSAPAPWGALHGHVARGHPLLRELAEPVEALAVFSGPSGYVSPSWYPTKAETGRVVPTWNYSTAHAHGRLRSIDDRTWLRHELEQLTGEHEARRPVPWRIADAPVDFIERMLGGIGGLELSITRLVGTHKVSQNRSEADRAGGVAGLLAEGTDAGAALADLVRNPHRD